MIEVVSPGLLTTIQDLGRPGLGHLGVPRSGAADPRALILANRLVGNDDGAAALEATLQGPALRFLRAATVALAGGEVDARVADRTAPMNRPFAIAAGELLSVGAVTSGVRTYVAVHGGVDVPPTLGSRSCDTLTGLGPAPLAPGDALPLGRGYGGVSAGHVAAAATPPPPPARETRLRIVFGPRDDWFSDAACTQLTSEPYMVTATSNRVGARLEGPPLEHARSDELRSEGVATGALQVPGSGLPILLLPDHPTTGGYPVIAVVVSDDLPLAGQLRPGTAVRFAV